MHIRTIPGVEALKFSLSEIYGFGDEERKGRLISLGSSLMTSFYNVFITGIFYTRFLSMYGMSITGVGIVTFIPFISSCFSVFSSSILDKFKKKKTVLLAAKIYFYAMYIIATNLMPQLITDPDERLTWFVIIQFLAHSVYALFSPGLTAWFYRFYPMDNEQRTRYIVYNQTLSAILSSIILLLSGVLADALAGSSSQDLFILALRYLAFVLVLIDVGMQACAKEYPEPPAPKLKLVQVFTLPFQYKKFLLCMILMFIWNYNSNLNNGLWNYHLLNHLNFTYTMLNGVSMSYAIILLATSKFWRSILHRYSWIKTFGIGVLLFVPTEFAMFMLTPNSSALYVVTALVQQFFNVCLNFSYANILYMNLPEENSTAHVAFNTIGCNLFAFLGMISGTWVSSWTGDNTIPFLGMDVYAVQFTTLMRAAIMTIMGLLLIIRWKDFTPKHEIEMLSRQKA